MNNMLLKPFYLPVEIYLHNRTFDYNVHDKPVQIGMLRENLYPV